MFRLNKLFMGKYSHFDYFTDPIIYKLLQMSDVKIMYLLNININQNGLSSTDILKLLRQVNDIGYEQYLKESKSRTQQWLQHQFTSLQYSQLSPVKIYDDRVDNISYHKYTSYFCSDLLIFVQSNFIYVFHSSAFQKLLDKRENLYTREPLPQTIVNKIDFLEQQRIRYNLPGTTIKETIAALSSDKPDLPKNNNSKSSGNSVFPDGDLSDILLFLNENIPLVLQNSRSSRSPRVPGNIIIPPPETMEEPEDID